MTDSPKCQEPGCGLEMVLQWVGSKTDDFWLCPRGADAHALCAKVAELEAKLEEVITPATDFLNEIRYLMGESGGVYGLHLNGDNAPWAELEPGGQFERLTAMDELDAVLTRESERNKVLRG